MLRNRFGVCVEWRDTYDTHNWLTQKTKPSTSRQKTVHSSWFTTQWYYQAATAPKTRLIYQTQHGAKDSKRISCRDYKHWWDLSLFHTGVNKLLTQPTEGGELVGRGCFGSVIWLKRLEPAWTGAVASGSHTVDTRREHRAGSQRWRGAVNDGAQPDYVSLQHQTGLLRERETPNQSHQPQINHSSVTVSSSMLLSLPSFSLWLY